VCWPSFNYEAMMFAFFSLPAFISVLIRPYLPLIKTPIYDIIHDFFGSLALPFFIASIICVDDHDAEGLWITLLILTTIFFAFSLIEGAIFKCSFCLNPYQMFQKAISEPSNSEAELQYLIEVFRRQPPILQYSLIQEPQTPDKKSSPRVISGPNFQQYQDYQTWEDRSSSIVFPGPGIYYVDFNIQTVFSSKLQSTIEQRQISVNSHYHGSRYFANINAEVYTSYKPTFFVIGGEPFKKSLFYKSCGFSTIYALSKFIPLRSFISSLILRHIKKFTINTIKYVSDTDEYRCQAYKIDTSANISIIGFDLPFRSKVIEDPPVAENILSHQFSLDYIQDVLPSIVTEDERNSISQSSNKKKIDYFSNDSLMHINVPQIESPIINQSSAQTTVDQKSVTKNKLDPIHQKLIDNQEDPYQADI